MKGGREEEDVRIATVSPSSPASIVADQGGYRWASSPLPAEVSAFVDKCAGLEGSKFPPQVDERSVRKCPSHKLPIDQHLTCEHVEEQSAPDGQWIRRYLCWNAGC